MIGGGAVLHHPNLLPFVLGINLWLLGYHHVIATMTRVLFDVESFREYRVLVTWVPLAVLISTVALYHLVGKWAISTVYLHWQWFHYTRQSYGIAMAYRRKADPGGVGPRLATVLALYALPVWGLLHRSYQQPATFLNVEIRLLPVPGLVVAAAGAVAVASIAWWLVSQIRAWAAGRLQVPYALYVISHLVIFASGYLLIPTINEGWLVLNIWHNAQYILFVWMYNNRRFQNRIDPNYRFLSMLSQWKCVGWYFTFFLSISTIVYFAIDLVLRTMSAPEWVSLSAIVYATINFHHYVVDGVVWRLRQARVRQNLGLAV